MNRRKFIHAAAVAGSLPTVLPSYANSRMKKDGGFPENVSLGLITRANNPEEDLKVVMDLGFFRCQLNRKEYSPELARRLSATLTEYRLSPTTLICMGPGPYKYNFSEGPQTIGLVSPGLGPAWQSAR